MIESGQARCRATGACSKMSDSTIICVSCGFKNTEPLAGGRCASCGAHVSFEADVLLGEGDQGLRQGGF